MHLISLLHRQVVILKSILSHQSWLLVFTDDGALSQMIVCAENEELFEMPGETLLEGIMHLMAAYYVYNVEYPRGCKGLLYFIQDILMERSGSGKRPTRYKTFINRL